MKTTECNECLQYIRFHKHFYALISYCLHQFVLKIATYYEIGHNGEGDSKSKMLHVKVRNTHVLEKQEKKHHSLFCIIFEQIHVCASNQF